MFSPTQLIASSGLIQGRGLGISANMVSKLNTVESTDNLNGLLRQIANSDNTPDEVITILREQIPGLALVVPSDYEDVPDNVAELDVTTSIRDRADYLMSGGVKGFMSAFNTAAASGGMTSNLLGSLKGVTDTGFAGMAPGVKNYTDQLTGGISSKFGPTATDSVAALESSGLASVPVPSDPTAIAGSISAVTAGLGNLGTLYDTKNPGSIGDPVALITNLKKQGLLSSTGLGDTLLLNGIDAENIADADPVIITDTLKTVTGPDVDKIVKDCQVKLPSGVTLNNAADFLAADKMLGASASKSIPGGSLLALGAQLSGFVGKNVDVKALVGALSKIEIPSFPSLNAMSAPVPEEDIAIIKASVPSGSGTFGNPKVQDMLGTVSGHVHTDELDNIINATNNIVFDDLGKALLQSAEDLWDEIQDPTLLVDEGTEDEHYEIDPYFAETFALAVDNVVVDLTLSAEVTTANEAVTKMVDQLKLEVVNCEKAGIDPTAEPAGVMGQLSSALKLPSFGLDKQDLGLGTMLAAMATNDKYGEAIRASMSEGKTGGLLDSIGAPKVGAVDVSELAKQEKAKTGGGLTPQQKENVIADAKAKNIPEDQALSNASLFGYNSAYFENLGYPPA